MVKRCTKTIHNFRGTLSKKGLRTCYCHRAQTQITVRAAHWVVKLEKLTVGHGLELHTTLCVNFRHILAIFILKWIKICHILRIIFNSVLSDNLV